MSPCTIFSMVIFFMVCLDGIYGVSEYDCGHLHQFSFESLTSHWLYTYLLFISWALFPAVFLSDPLVHVPLSGCLGDASHGRPPLCLLLITWGGGSHMVGSRGVSPGRSEVTGVTSASGGSAHQPALTACI